MKTFCIIVCSVISLLTSSITFAREVSYLPGMVLGKGYDDIAGTVKQDCLTFDNHVEPASAIAAAEWSWDEVSSNADLLQITQADASASVNVGLFSASAEMSMLSKNQLSNYDANVLASANVKLNWNIAINAKLKPEYSQLAQQDPAQFVNVCGRHYILGVEYGGTFYKSKQS